MAAITPNNGMINEGTWKRVDNKIIYPWYVEMKGSTSMSKVACP
jgi:hypothetical protein